MKDLVLNNFPLSTFIGLRYLRAKKSNRSISFFTSVSLLGISLGVAAVVIVLSVMNGFEKEMHHRILGMLPHMSIENLDNKKHPEARVLDLHNWHEVANSVLNDPLFSQHLESAAPYVQMDALINKHEGVRAVRVIGIDPEFEKKSSILDQFMLAGKLSVLQKPEQKIILGSDIARAMGIIVGDEISLVFPMVKSSRLTTRYFNFKVAGFFDVGAEADGLLAFINIKDATQLKYSSDKIDGVRFQLYDVEQVEKVEQPLQEYFSNQFRFDTWKSTYGQLFQTVKIEKVMTGSMLMLIVLIAAFNTVSSLSMLVAEKHNSIAVLRTMGFSASQVVAIFFVQGLFISGFGVLIGLFSGVLIALYLENIIYFVNSFQLFWIAPLKSEVRFMDVVSISVLSFIISLLASIIPARRAANIEPADALRY